MANAVRLLVVSTQIGLMTIIKSGLQSKADVEMIINIKKPAEAEGKFSRLGLNVMLIDLDTAPAEVVHTQRYEMRYNMLVLYTACSSASAAAVVKNKLNDFILKPPMFTDLTASNYLTAIYKRFSGFRKQQLPPNFRDMSKLVDANKKIVAIASSTGGTEALEKIFKGLPVEIPPIVIVQHMPSGFTKLFAERLNAVYPQDIKEADTGDYLKQGQILLAPADRHMRLVRQSGKLAVECFTGTKMHGVMPAADILFDSVAELLKANAVGVVLTGMGADGARGLLQMHKAGAKTIGQNQATCVVYGMPKVAKGLGAVEFELPIEQIADKIMSLV